MARALWSQMTDLSFVRQQMQGPGESGKVAYDVVLYPGILSPRLLFLALVVSRPSHSTKISQQVPLIMQMFCWLPRIEGC